jgi:NADH:ubiquinone reductase (non-electrogenic)
MQPIRYLTRFKKRAVNFIEGDCERIDAENQTIYIKDNSEVSGPKSLSSLTYDYLVVATGAENATFGIPGVKEYACFLKESWDARKIRTKLMDCLESAAFPGQTDKEIERLLHMVVVGGGPTGIDVKGILYIGVEYAAELHDFLVDDLLDWYPTLADKIRITLIEAQDKLLPMFSKSLIDYTEKHLTDSKIELLKNTAVKKVEKDHIVVQDKDMGMRQVDYGLLVWATGNAARGVITDLIKSLPAEQNQRRGLVVTDNLKVKGASNIFALGDATATRWAPTAQVASGQGRYLARIFNELGQNPNDEALVLESLGPFTYLHAGTLAYVGSDKAIADLPGGIKSSGLLTHFLWRSAYLSNLFSGRNRVLVGFDWIKKTVFGRDISRE